MKKSLFFIAIFSMYIATSSCNREPYTRGQIPTESVKNLNKESHTMNFSAGASLDHGVH